ncbi:MAG: hypothetical protein JKZ03_02900 [Flavobacteriaceae bacterium]|nr:hypothetical protein [Flavobacteriaceae bacterium]
MFKLVMILLMGSNIVYGQHILTNHSDVKKYVDIPQERIFVHHNASLLFAGEYLYYKMYCLSTDTNTLSHTSKIAYIELVGEGGERIIKNKIKLTEGLGQGEFFIPTSVPSGNYKLLGNTQWMRNGDKNHFFHTDIAIINPYQGNQENILALNTNTDESFKTNSANGLDALIEDRVTKNNLLDHIALSTNTQTFSKRSPVSLSVKSLKEDLSHGSYSISVRKIDAIKTPSMHNTFSYSALYKSNDIKLGGVGTHIYLPESKGEMVYGTVVNIETNLPVAKKKVVMSILGNKNKPAVAYTNSEGLFYFYIDVNYNGAKAILQVFEEDYQHKVVMNTHQSLDYSDLTFNEFKINSKMKDLIQQRSVYNQIQNGYFSVKPDTVKTITLPEPFYGGRQKTYNLDDYTSFDSVEGIMLEIINHAWTTKDKNGNPVFIVRGHEFNPYYELGLLPLLLVDGIYVQNHETVINYNAKDIKNVTISKDDYYDGTTVYKGIMNIETKTGEFHKVLNESYISHVDLFSPELKKDYFHQTYSELTKNETDRIPDFRQQLLWMPELIFNQDETTITFFTSDNKGDYEISLEGFTDSGKPVSVKKMIRVE